MKVWEHLRGVSYTPKNKKVSSIIPLGWTPLTSQQESLLTKEERAQYKKIKQVYELQNNTENVINDILSKGCPMIDKKEIEIDIKYIE